MPRRPSSSARHDYQTPGWFLDLVRAVAPIGLDPCTTGRNPTEARFWFPPYMNGLSRNWRCMRREETAFVNPPYGRQLPLWAEKIVQEDVPTIVLVPARTEAAWWRKLYAWCDHCLLWSSPEYGSRISFVNPDTGLPVRGNDHASTVFYRNGSILRGNLLNPMDSRFTQVFNPHGTMVK